ncbi:hypothetical protein WJX82_010240 [Trebouxia sp. C0006]
MPGDLLSLSGNLIGVVGLAWATFTGVSYFKVRKKIDEAVDAGEDPYELKVDRKKVRRAKPIKKAKSKKERTNRA